MVIVIMTMMAVMGGDDHGHCRAQCICSLCLRYWLITARPLVMVMVMRLVMFMVMMMTFDDHGNCLQRSW